MGLDEALGAYHRQRKSEAAIARNDAHKATEAAHESAAARQTRLDSVIDLGKEAIAILSEKRVRPTGEVLEVLDMPRGFTKGPKVRPPRVSALDQPNQRADQYPGYRGPYKRTYRVVGAPVWVLPVGGFEIFLDPLGMPRSGDWLDLRRLRDHRASRKVWLLVSEVPARYYVDRSEFQGSAAQIARGLLLDDFPPQFLDLDHSSGEAYVNLHSRYSTNPGSRYPEFYEKDEHYIAAYETALAEGVARLMGNRE